jgi:hypothetical protein
MSSRTRSWIAPVLVLVVFASVVFFARYLPEPSESADKKQDDVAREAPQNAEPPSALKGNKDSDDKPEPEVVLPKTHDPKPPVITPFEEWKPTQEQLAAYFVMAGDNPVHRRLLARAFPEECMKLFGDAVLTPDYPGDDMNRSFAHPRPDLESPISQIEAMGVFRDLAIFAYKDAYAVASSVQDYPWCLKRSYAEILMMYHDMPGAKECMEGDLARGNAWQSMALSIYGQESPGSDLATSKILRDAFNGDLTKEEFLKTGFMAANLAMAIECTGRYKEHAKAWVNKRYLKTEELYLMHRAGVELSEKNLARLQEDGFLGNVFNQLHKAELVR